MEPPIQPFDIETTDQLLDPTAASRIPLRQRVASNVTWSVSGMIISQCIGFVRSIVLARLLAPEDFGVLGMAFTVTAAFAALTTIRLDQAMIARRSPDLDASLNTVWSAEVVRSIGVAILLTLSAFPLASFYGRSELRMILPILGVASILQGFQNVGLVLFSKELRFARLFWFELTVNLTGLAVTIGLALVLHDMWALVIGILITSALSTVLSYVFHSYRPRFTFDRGALKHAVGFGKFVLLGEAGSYVISTGDNVVVGRLLGAAPLGLYALAYSLASAPVLVLIGAVGKVLFPAYVAITENDRERVRKVFTTVFTLISLAFVVIASAVFLLADEIVSVLFGPNWAGAGDVLRILVIGLPFRGAAHMTATVLFSLDEARRMLVARILEPCIFLLVLIPLVINYSLIGAAWAAVIVFVFASISRTLALQRVLPGVATQLLKISSLLAIVTLFGYMLARLGLHYLTDPSLRLVVGGISSVVIPVTIVLIARPDLKHLVLRDVWKH